MGNNNTQSAFSALNNRIWFVEGGVHPDRVPDFLSIGKISTDPSKTIGEETRITAPDPNNYNRDISIGTVPGSEERATFSISTRYTDIESVLQRWKNRRCPVDVYVLSGKCSNPQDFTEGWEKIVYFKDGKVSGHSFENLGAFGQDENNPANEMVDMTSEDYFEIREMGMFQVGSGSTVREVMSVDIYTGNDCEDCPDPCDRILVSMLGTGATPGTQPILLYSADGGATWSQQDITTMFSTERIEDGIVIGEDIVYVSNEGNEIHYTNVERVYLNNNTWQQTDTGFVVGSGPNAITAADPRHIWIAADAGYIYFSRDHKVEVSVQEEGVLTAQNLNAISCFDRENVLAVGNSNAVLFTEDGETWQSVTGPAVGVNLGACWMWNDETWLVGEGAGGTGALWLTQNKGVSWTEIGLPANYDRIDKIVFVNQAEGYLSARGGGQSYILRTITGGAEWVVLPQGRTGIAQDNSYLIDVAVCSEFSNTAFSGGLADDGSAGIVFKHTG